VTAKIQNGEADSDERLDAEHCNKPNKAVIDIALAAYDRFFTAFRTNNHYDVLAMFAPEGRYHFYGTQSTTLVTTREGLQKYFVASLDGSRGETKAVPFQRSAMALSDSVVQVSGTWQSERTLDGKMTTAGPSRNTVVLKRYGDKWLITQFHNSPVPKPAAKPPAAPK
jgi:hypothetical protein